MELRLCMDIDASWWPLGGKLKLGVKRSPVRTPAQALALAREIDRRRGMRLVGIMAYEAQIAGLGDSPASVARGLAIRALQSRSAAELAVRRAAIVVALGEVCELEFVNGGGTGSLHGTSAEPVISEIGAGSGLYGPGLFDPTAHSRPGRRRCSRCRSCASPPRRSPRRSAAAIWPPAGCSARLPRPYLPSGLQLDKQEGAGEVQTPLLGAAGKAAAGG